MLRALPLVDSRSCQVSNISHEKFVVVVVVYVVFRKYLVRVLGCALATSQARPPLSNKPIKRTKLALYV